MKGSGADPSLDQVPEPFFLRFRQAASLAAYAADDRLDAAALAAGTTSWS